MPDTMTYDLISKNRKIEGIVSAQILDSYGDVLSQDSLLQKLQEMIGRGVAPISLFHSEDIVGRWDKFELTSVNYMGKTYPAIKGYGEIFETTLGDYAWNQVERGFVRGLSISAFGDTITEDGTWSIADVHAVSLVDRPAVPIAIILENDVIERAIKSGYKINPNDVVKFKNSKHTLVKCYGEACNIAKSCKDFICELQSNKTRLSNETKDQIETQNIDIASLVKADDFNAKTLEINESFVKVTGEIEDLKKGINSILEKLTKEDTDEEDSDKENEEEMDNEDNGEDETEKEKSAEKDLISGGKTPSINMIQPDGLNRSNSLIKGTIVNPMISNFNEWVEKYGNKEALRRHNIATLSGDYNYINNISIPRESMVKEVPELYGAFIGGSI